MRRLRYLPAARRDLLDIVDHISREAGSQVTARRFVERLRAQCQKLASLPGRLGRPRPELLPDLRSFPYRGYVIFFRYIGQDSIEVLNIVERHRDIGDRFEA